MDSTKARLKKEWLYRYNRNTAKVKRLKEKLRTLNNRVLSAKTPRYSNDPRGGVPVTMDDMMLDISELESRIKRLEAKGKIYRNEIIDAIDTLEDYRYIDILEGYFIRGEGIEDIANELGYSVRYVWRLYAEAVDKINISGID